MDKSKYELSKNQTQRLAALYLYKKLQKNPDSKKDIISNIKELFQLGNVKNYSKPVKYNKMTKEEGDEGEKKIPYKLDEEKYIKVYKLIEDIYGGKILSNKEDLNKILRSQYLKYELDFNKIPIEILVKIVLNEDNFEEIKLDNKIPFSKKHLEDLIKSLYDECKNDEKNISKVESFVDKYCNYFTNEQIEVILKFDKFDFDSLKSELFERMFSNASEINKEEAVKKLKEIIKIMDKFKNTDVYKRYLLLSILDLNIKLKNYEFDIFIDYITLPLSYDELFYNISKDIRAKVEKDCQMLKYKIRDYSSLLNNEKEIIEKHLKHFYLYEKFDFNKFNKYFNENYIKKFYSKMQFYSGSEIPTKDEILSRGKIDKLMEESILTICDYNKERFNINDNIELFLEIKNIQTLYINVYEINTENYYYSNKEIFDNNLSLEGIVPTFEDKLIFNEKPQLLLEKKVSLTEIPKKRGLFVVEFIGNGHVSRAVIQRGNLKCIHKNTVNGKVAYILDEENNILKGDKVGMWIDNVWYPSIKDTGAILIPYSINGNTFILKYEDFCCLEKDIYIPDEEYKLEGYFIINEESFIMGNVAKILVRPYLFICDELCPLEYLTDVKITVATLTIENNQAIPSLNIIDNVKLSYNKEFCFDFQVPPKLEKMGFILSGKIRNKSLDKDENLSFEKVFEFNKNYEYDSLIKKSNEGNYLIYLLGKNGEPKINHSVDLYIKHLYQQKINNGNQILLESNSEGIIDLGQLKDVEKINLDRQVIELNQSLYHS